MQGWLKFHRQITEHWLYQEKRVFSKYEAWLDIILHTNHADNKFLIKGELIDCKAGQTARSQVTLAKSWNWGRKKVANFLMLLQKDGMIYVETTKVTTILTIVNWENFQNSDTKRDTKRHKLKGSTSTSSEQVGTSEGTTEEHQRNIKGTSEEHQRNTIKNEKNDKNENNEKIFLGKQIKIEKKPNEIEKELRNYFNSNTDAKVSLFENLESGSGKTFTMDEKTAVVKRLTVFSNDYALRKSWDSNEATETKIIRFTNYILTSIQNGYELSSTTKPTASYKQEQKGYRVSPDFEKLIDEMAGGTKYF